MQSFLLSFLHTVCIKKPLSGGLYASDCNNVVAVIEINVPAAVVLVVPRVVVDVNTAEPVLFPKDKTKSVHVCLFIENKLAGCLFFPQSFGLRDSSRLAEAIGKGGGNIAAKKIFLHVPRFFHDLRTVKHFRFLLVPFR